MILRILLQRMTSSTIETSSNSEPAWKLDWLTPMRCRTILIAVLALGFFSHIYYLHHTSIDLAGDEAQYWDWSRNLDLSYYSKGPLIAYIIRASCAIFGDTMPAVRYPAVVISVLTSIVTYLLTRKLFGSERLALGTVLLFHILPIFIAGSALMTIDPPMFLCWALATYFAAIAIFDQKRWFWLLVGLSIGVGSLAKYAALLWFLGAIGFLISTRRKHDLRACLGALLLAIVCLTPVFVWNHQHDWVSLKHVARQTGVAAGPEGFQLERVLGNVIGQLAFMLSTQLAAVGPALAFLMIWAVVAIFRAASAFSRPSPLPSPGVPGEGVAGEGAQATRDKLAFLAWIGLAYWGINFIFSFLTKIQPNWPAPAYFTLLVLTGHFLGTRLQNLQTWKPVRGWFWGAVVTGLVVIPIAHDTTLIYPLLQPFGRIFKRDMLDMDPLARLRGWRVFGKQVSQELQAMGPGAFVLCDDYQQTAEMAFYLEGQPKTYCAGPYFSDPKRLSQYDMWPDRRLDASSPLIGRNAIFIGKGSGLAPPEDIKDAFEHVEKATITQYELNGVPVRNFKAYRCFGFKGFPPIAGLHRDY
jgi:undecaprenyl-diphosphatase